MNSRQAEEARLAYVESGTGAPVVFIHGLTFSRRTWDPIVRRLEGRFRCIAIDLPGHGASPGVSDALELDDVGHRLHALLTGLGIERPVLVGHSMGAMEATVYGATFPVAGIVNVDQTLDVQPFIRLIQEIAPVLGGPNFSAAFEPIRLEPVMHFRAPQEREGPAST
jgi:pimeloyl-ACP methyl ester carboxylesterase